MIKFIKKIFKYLANEHRNSLLEEDTKIDTLPPIVPEIDKNLNILRGLFGNSRDFVIREFNFGCDKQSKGALVYIDGMANKEMIDNSILKTLMYDICLLPNNNNFTQIDIDTINNNLLSVSDVKKIGTYAELLNCLLSGCTILFINGSIEVLRIDTKKWEKRNIDEPKTENVVRGPREGFTESLYINVTLLRRKIKSPDLMFESLTLGERTKTDICIAYINGLVNPNLVNEIKQRLNKIKIDSILESGYIEAFIEDAPFSIFPTVGNSEKPDNVAAKILEGRAAIIVDGSPFVLTAPLLFIENFQCSEDYYSRPYYSSVIRMLRFLAYFITILAPAIYVALTTFHQELIPTLLLYTMAAGHEGIPFPAAIEAAVMIVIFEILREAGVRLPKTIGSAVSIVGALVIGESAVSAGLIGPIMVIIVALTAISSFVIPSLTDSVSLLRYFLLFLAGFIGGFGIIMGLLMVFLHLASLRSFGAPYLSPMAPLNFKDMKDSMIRVPLWKMITRPSKFGVLQIKRQESDRRPKPPNTD